MTDHLFLIHCHKDIEQAGRLLGILREHYSENSGAVVCYDGEPNEKAVETFMGKHGSGYIRGRYEPEKCAGIIKGLNELIFRAGDFRAKVATFLHADMVPTNREHWWLFLRRFLASGRSMTYAPMLPKVEIPSFMTLTFRLPEALRYFPINLNSPLSADVKKAGHWCNESATWASWRGKGWKPDVCYPMSLLNWPIKEQCDKLIHGPGWEYKVADFVPESSVVHSHDPVFWSGYEKVCRF